MSKESKTVDANGAKAVNGKKARSSSRSFLNLFGKRQSSHNLAEAGPSASSSNNNTPKTVPSFPERPNLSESAQSLLKNLDDAKLLAPIVMQSPSFQQAQATYMQTQDSLFHQLVAIINDEGAFLKNIELIENKINSVATYKSRSLLHKDDAEAVIRTNFDLLVQIYTLLQLNTVKRLFDEVIRLYMSDDKEVYKKSLLQILHDFASHDSQAFDIPRLLSALPQSLVNSISRNDDHQALFNELLMTLDLYNRAKQQWRDHASTCSLGNETCPQLMAYCTGRQYVTSHEFSYAWLDKLPGFNPNQPEAVNRRAEIVREYCAHLISSDQLRLQRTLNEAEKQAFAKHFPEYQTEVMSIIEELALGEAEVTSSSDLKAVYSGVFDSQFKPLILRAFRLIHDLPEGKLLSATQRQEYREHFSDAQAIDYAINKLTEKLGDNHHEVLQALNEVKEKYGHHYQRLVEIYQALDRLVKEETTEQRTAVTQMFEAASATAKVSPQFYIAEELAKQWLDKITDTTPSLRHIGSSLLEQLANSPQATKKRDKQQKTHKSKQVRPEGVPRLNFAAAGLFAPNRDGENGAPVASSSMSSSTTSSAASSSNSSALMKPAVSNQSP